MSQEESSQPPDLSDLAQYQIKIPPSAYKSTSGSTSTGSVGGFYYIPNFITAQEESYLVSKIQTAPQPKWKILANRRLQYWGGQVSSKNTLIPEPLPEFMTRFPPLVQRIKETGAFGGSAHGEPNHCLVNEYKVGQGIMPHEDGDAYFHAVATVSLASHTLLDIYRWVEEDQDPSAEGETTAATTTTTSKVKAREQDPIFSILQEPRSLLITVGDAYTHFLHGIAERTRDEAQHLTKILNVNHLTDQEIKTKVMTAMSADKTSGKQGVDQIADVLIREDRISLTFRDVEKVSKGLGG